MEIELVRSKIHNATVTEADVDYEGSIGIDLDLLIASDIVPYEMVHVWNVTNGSRLQTYAIPEKAGSKAIKTNGCAALHCKVGDRIIIASVARANPENTVGFRPTVVILTEGNFVKSISQGRRSQTHMWKDIIKLVSSKLLGD